MKRFLVLCEEGGGIGYDTFVCAAENIRDLIIKYAEYTGELNTPLQKAIGGFGVDDTNDLLVFFNKWSYQPIKRIYEIAETVYIQPGEADE